MVTNSQIAVNKIHNSMWFKCALEGPNVKIIAKIECLDGHVYAMSVSTRKYGARKHLKFLQITIGVVDCPLLNYPRSLFQLKHKRGEMQ